MYLLYLDDAGSPGNASEKYFVLGGICVYEAQVEWFGREIDKLAAARNIVLDAKGTIYGTTEYGGADCKGDGIMGCGVVFSLTPPASPGGAWTEDVLYTLCVAARRVP